MIKTNLPAGVGYADFQLSTLRDVESAPLHVEAISPAVGQLITVSPRGPRIQNWGQKRALLVPSVKLRNRVFLDGYPLWQGTTSDIAEFFDQYTVRASTATLISTKRILTAGHSVIDIDIRSGNVFFVPNRKQSAKIALPRRRSQISVPRRAYYRVAKYFKGDNSGKGKDWAVLELERAVKRFAPITVADTNTPALDEFYTLQYPLGLPLKCSEAKIPENGNGMGHDQVLSDFGSGSSGAPLLGYSRAQRKFFILGVVTGDAKFGVKSVKSMASGRVIDPLKGQRKAVPQPLTRLTLNDVS